MKGGKDVHWKLGTESGMKGLRYSSTTQDAYVLNKNHPDPNAKDKEFVKSYKDRAIGSIPRIDSKSTNIAQFRPTAPI